MPCRPTAVALRDLASIRKRTTRAPGTTRSRWAIPARTPAGFRYETCRTGTGDDEPGDGVVEPKLNDGMLMWWTALPMLSSGIAIATATIAANTSLTITD